MDKSLINQQELTSVKELFKLSFETSKSIWLKLILLILGFLGILILSIIPFLLLVIAAAFFNNIIIYLVVGTFIVFYGFVLFILSGWGSSATLILLNEPNLPIKEIIKNSWKFAIPVTLVSFLSSLLSILSLGLFIIPAIIIGIFFTFAKYEAVIEKRGVLSSLRRSIFIVKTHFSSIFIRLVVILLLNLLVSFIIQSIVGASKSPELSILTLPVNIFMSIFSTAYSFNLFKQAEAATPDKSGESRLRWILLIDLISFIIIVLIGFAVFNFVRSLDFNKLLNEKPANTYTNNSSSVFAKQFFKAAMIENCKKDVDEKYCECMADYLINKYSVDQLSKFEKESTDVNMVTKELKDAAKFCAPK